MSARCELSDLPIDQCACRIHGPAPEPPPRTFFAAWRGTCAECREEIEPGDLIRPSQLTGGPWIHEECT